MCTHNSFTEKDIDADFALSLIQYFCPTLRWGPTDSLLAAELAFLVRYGDWPDYDLMATHPKHIFTEVTSYD